MGAERNCHLSPHYHFFYGNDGNSTTAWLSLECFKRVLVTKNPVSPNTDHD